SRDGFIQRARLPLHRRQPSHHHTQPSGPRQTLLNPLCTPKSEQQALVQIEARGSRGSQGKTITIVIPVAPVSPVVESVRQCCPVRFSFIRRHSIPVTIVTRRL